MSAACYWVHVVVHVAGRHLLTGASATVHILLLKGNIERQLLGRADHDASEGLPCDLSYVAIPIRSFVGIGKATQSAS